MYTGTFEDWVIRQCGKLTPRVGIQVYFQLSENPSVLNPEYLFQNNDANCPLTSCEILEQGCMNPLVVQEITIITSPLGIQVNLDNTLGFEYTICLRCSNGYQTEELDNFMLLQYK